MSSSTRLGARNAIRRPLTYFYSLDPFNHDEIITKLKDDGALNEGSLLIQQTTLQEKAKGQCRCGVKGLVAEFWLGPLRNNRYSRFPFCRAHTSHSPVLAMIDTVKPGPFEYESQSGQLKKMATERPPLPAILKTNATLKHDHNTFVWACRAFSDSETTQAAPTSLPGNDVLLVLRAWLWRSSPLRSTASCLRNSSLQRRSINLPERPFANPIDS